MVSFEGYLMFCAAVHVSLEGYAVSPMPFLGWKRTLSWERPVVVVFMCIIAIDRTGEKILQEECE